MKSAQYYILYAAKLSVNWRLYFVFLCLSGGLSFHQVMGQNNARHVEMLKLKLPLATSDSVKVDYLNELSEKAGWRVGKYDTATYYTDLALKLSQKSGYKKGKAKAYYNTGAVFYLKSDYVEALKNYLLSITINREIGNLAGIADCYNGLAIISHVQGNYPESLKYYLMALEINEQTGNANGISKNYNNIALLHSEQGNYNEALKTIIKSLEIKESLKDYPGLAHSYNSMGIIYYQQKKYEEALINYKKSLEICQNIDNREIMAANYTGLGRVNMGQHKFNEALENFNSGLKINESLGNKKGVAENYNNIGDVYFQQNILDQSKMWQHKALTLSKQIGAKEEIKDSYEGLASVDLALGDYKSAFENYKQFIIYKDSLYSEENIRKIMHAALQYEFDKKTTLLQYEKQLSDEQLLRSKQELGLRQKELELSNKEKDIQHLAFLKEKAEKQENERRLSLIEKDQELQLTKLGTLEKEKQLRESELATRNQELETQQAQRNLFVGGTVLMLMLAGSVSIGLIKSRKQKKTADKLRAQSDTLLHNILPEEVARELKEKGTTVAKQFDETSVLFTDFVNFTQIAEQLTPQELVHELDECFTAFDEIMERYKLEKIKTVGDAYIAVCGLPVENSRHALQAVQAALEIRDFIEERNKTKRVFEIRIGVNSGSLVAGIVGVKKFAYDIWGDTVNTAARMESSGVPGKVNISSSTYELIKDDFNCEFRSEVEAKNKGKLKMYFVEPAHQDQLLQLVS